MKNKTKLATNAVLGLTALALLLVLVGMLGNPVYAWTKESATDLSGKGLFTADSLSTKKVVASATTGDSVISYTDANNPKIVFSIKGSRGTLSYAYDGTMGVNSLYFPYWSGTYFYSPNGTNLKLWTAGQNEYVNVCGGKTVGYKVCLGYPDSSKGVVIDSAGLRAKMAGGTITADTVKATKGLAVGGGDMLTKIYMQNDSLYIDLSTGAKLQMKPVIIPAP